MIVYSVSWQITIKPTIRVTFVLYFFQSIVQSRKSKLPASSSRDPFDLPNEGHFTPEKVTNKNTRKGHERKNLAFQITFKWRMFLMGQIVRPRALPSVEIFMIFMAVR